MLLLPTLLAVLASLGSTTAPSTDPCDLAGSYDLDRAPIHHEIMASMDASTAELGVRPSSGIARIEWDARKEAYAAVRAQAVAGEIVPVMDLDLEGDGTFTHRIEDAHGAGETRSTAVGTWKADATCSTITLEVAGEDPMEGAVDGDRITLSRTNPAGINTLRGLEFERAR